MTSVNILNGGTLKVGDTLPELRAKLLDGDDPFNLDGYDVSIKIQRTDGDSLSVDDTATIDAAGRGIVTYAWSTGDTDTGGIYLLELVADDGAGSEITFPNSGTATIHIQERL